MPTPRRNPFTQVCALATAPISIMAKVRNTGGTLAEMATALEDEGYEVYATDATNSQVELSACAGPDARWVLTPVADFAAACGGWTLDDNVTPISPDDDQAVKSCEPSTHGPPCNTDADCADAPNCVRCAGSGYCTDVPLFGANATAT